MIDQGVVFGTTLRYPSPSTLNCIKRVIVNCKVGFDKGNEIHVKTGASQNDEPTHDAAWLQPRPMVPTTTRRPRPWALVGATGHNQEPWSRPMVATTGPCHGQSPWLRPSFHLLIVNMHWFFDPFHPWWYWDTRTPGVRYNNVLEHLVNELKTLSFACSNKVYDLDSERRII